MKKLILILALLLSSCSYMNEQTIEAVVNDKERVNTREYSYYLVFTDKGTFKIEDQLFYGNFNSSDIYGSLKRESKYKFTLHGYRIGFLSSYPVIEKAEGLD
jgi:hypothetical protein